jgi:hypothetical protein
MLKLLTPGTPVEAGTKVSALRCVKWWEFASGMTRYFALVYEAPILGAQQHLKVVVAHMNAADEPVMADLTAASR